MTKTQKIQNCLVTGASGFVGRTLCRQLQKQGIRVRALLRVDIPGPWDEVAKGDLTSLTQQDKAIFTGIDTIFHLAAISHRKASPEQYQRVNVEASYQLAELALENGVKNFIYVSSTKAVAEPKENIINECFEDYPNTLYGQSKRCAEDKLLNLAGFTHFSIIRPCLIYGEKVKGVFSLMVKAIKAGVFPPLPNLNDKKSMVSVDDVASAIIVAATHKVCHGKKYFITDGKTYSIADIYKTLCSGLNSTPWSWHLPRFLFSWLGYCGNLCKVVWRGFPLSSNVIYTLLESAQYSSEQFKIDTGWIAAEDFYDIAPKIIALQNAPK